MNFLWKLFLLISVFAGSSAMAQSRSKGQLSGLSIDGAIGQPHVTIKNPDGSDATYSGIALQGRGIISLFSAEQFAVSVAGSMRYMDLTNNANTEGTKEIANHIGPGAGLRLDVFRLYAGAEYHYMLARHYMVAKQSREIQYEYQPFSYYFGFRIPWGSMSFGGSYTVTTGTVPSAGTGLSTSSAYSDTVYMIHATFHTGASIGKVFQALFK